MRKIISLLLVAVMLLSSFAGLQVTAAAETGGSCGEHVTWSLNTETGVLTISGSGPMYHYNRDDVYNPFSNNKDIKKLVVEEGVTTIGIAAFSGCTALQEIVLSDTVEEIGENSFDNCDELTVFKPGAGLKSIGENAFYCCSRLQDFTIPASLQSIGECAFASCLGFRNMVIPGTVKTIDSSAFAYCEAMQSVVIQSGVTTIGAGAFAGCYRLASAQLPNTITTISKNLFYECHSLTDISIPDNIKSIGEESFYKCKQLSAITIPDGVESIGKNAFAGCISAKSLFVSKTVTDIAAGAFSCCSGGLESIVVDSANAVYDSRDNCNAMMSTADDALIIGCKNTTIPQNTTEIGHYAFWRCSDLGNVVLPNTVTKIGSRAFYECEGLTSIALGTGVKTLGDYAFYGCADLSAVTGGSALTTIEYYAFSSCSDLEGFTFGDSLKKIGQSAFENCTVLESIDIPDSVTSLGKCAFAECIALKDIAIGSGVQTIEESTFANCAALTSVEIPNTVKRIEKNAFEACSALESIDLGSGLEYIGTEAFMDCVALESITIPDSVTEIGDGVFRNCSALLSADTGNGLPFISAEMFRGCSKLATVNFGNAVTSIKGFAFNGCGFENIVIPEKITQIQLDAFSDCALLKSVTISEGVTTLTTNVFKNCVNLTDVNLPASLVRIGKEAFAGCTSLSKIAFPENVKYCYKGAFSGCTALKEAKLNDKLTRIEQEAFSGCAALEHIEIPYLVSKIGVAAFQNCSSLTSVQLEDNTQIIQDDAFAGCSAIKDVYYIGSQEQWESTQIGENNECLTGATIHFNAIHRHNYVAEVTKQATCKEEGEITYTCACGDSYTKVIPLKNHTPAAAVKENEKAATCTEAGTYDEVIYCTVCGEEISRQSKSVKKLGHNYISEATPPTCTEKGFYTLTCLRCGDVRRGDDIPATGHTRGAQVKENVVEPKCGYAGSYDLVVYCTVCEQEISRLHKTTAPTGHNYEETVIEATCQTPGYSRFTCVNCGDTYTANFVPKLAHTPGEAVIENEKAATCTEAGSYDEVVYCTVCGTRVSKHTVTSAPLGHDYETTVVEPTCTHYGYTIYTCTRCEKMYMDYFVAPIGHTSAAAIKENEKAATCTEAGSYDEVTYCTVCKAEVSRTAKSVPALGHAYEETVIAPTCQTPGYSRFTCQRCGDSYTGKIVEPIAHTPAAAIKENEKAATCTEAGSFDEVVYCTVCKAEISRQSHSTEALGHQYVQKVYAPKAGALGYTMHTSNASGSSYKDTYTAQTGKVSGLQCKARSATAETFTWTAVAGVTGYQLQISDGGTQWARAVTSKTTSVKVTSLNAGVAYKFRIRTYITGPDGKNYFGPWTSPALKSPTLPAGTTLSKVTAGSKAFTAQWKKAAYTGYQIQYATNASFSSPKLVTIRSAATLSTTVKSLKAATTYYVRVRTYKTIDGTHYMSAWSSAVKIKTK
ncbi:MAG: leucine-rich repeat protein [Clostridia bacterium]|nr:leucine-rich repeat protein [Clostridia bacterium]